MVHHLVLDLKLLDLLREAARRSATACHLVHSSVALSAWCCRSAGIVVGRDDYDVRAWTGALLGGMATWCLLCGALLDTGCLRRLACTATSASSSPSKYAVGMQYCGKLLCIEP